MIVPPVVLGGTRSKGSVTLTTWEVPCNPLQMGCLQCLIAVSESELFLFKGSHMNSLYNWHRADIIGCQSEILCVLDFNTLISSSGHPNKWILLKWCFILFVLRVPSACFVLCVCLRCELLCSNFCVIISDCKAFAELVAWEPWPRTWFRLRKSRE